MRNGIGEPQVSVSSHIGALDSPPQKRPITQPAKLRRNTIVLAGLFSLIAVVTTIVILNFRAQHNISEARAGVQRIIDQESWALESSNWWQSLTHSGPSLANTLREDVFAGVSWVVEQEKRAFTTGNHELLRSLLDPNTPHQWRKDQVNRLTSESTSQPIPGSADILDWGHNEDIAWVKLPLPSTNNAREDDRLLDRRVNYQQLRFFRFEDDRWYLSSASTAGSGPAFTARTKYFEFRYHEPDKSLMSSITQDVDALYEQTMHDLGMAITSSQLIQIEFAYSLDEPTGNEKSQAIPVPSPQLFGSLEEFQYALGAIIIRTSVLELIDQAAQFGSEPVINGIIAWEAKQWGRILPEWDVMKTTAIQMRLEDGPYWALDYEYSILEMTITEYVVHAYSRRQLADLLTAAINHRALRDLIPAALYIDIGTFHHGWQEYLETTYGEAKP